MLKKKEVPSRVTGMFYQGVVASILFYGSESWVVSPSVLRELKGFHMEAVRWLTGMRPCKPPLHRCFCSGTPPAD